MPVVVKRDFRHRTGVMTGAYSTMISGGGASGRRGDGAPGARDGLRVAPDARRCGRSARHWRSRSGCRGWRGPAVGPRRRRPGAPAAPVRGLWRSPLAWQVTAFMGLQSLQFYALTAWAPTLFVDEGRSATEAGLLLSLAGVCSLLTSAITPGARRPQPDPAPPARGADRGLGGRLLGLLLAPGALAPLWMVLIGLGQGWGSASG